MAIVIANPVDGHSPGDEVTLAPHEEKRLVRAGMARAADKATAKALDVPPPPRQ